MLLKHQILEFPDFITTFIGCVCLFSYSNNTCLQAPQGEKGVGFDVAVTMAISSIISFGKFAPA